MKGHLKDIEGAIEDYKMAISLDPDDAIAHNNLGLLEEQLGFHLQAKKRFSQADELSELLKDSGIEMPGISHDEPRNIQKEIDEEKKQNPVKKSLVKEMMLVFTNKESRAEFFRFVRNGFK
jgi:tetratricopeptide (TPR) repeat protein